VFICELCIQLSVLGQYRAGLLCGHKNHAVAAALWHVCGQVNGWPQRGLQTGAPYTPCLGYGFSADWWPI